MVFLTIPIEQMATALENYGFTGGEGIGVTFSDTEPSNPQAGQLWLSSGNNELKIYNGVGWNLVTLSTTEQTQLASLGDTVTACQLAQTGAETARDKILSMTVASGVEGSTAIWNSTTGVLTIPRGNTGEKGIQGIQGTQGIQGDKGDTGTGLVVKGTDTSTNILLKVGVEGDFWIASDTGDGYSYISGAWVNTGQIRGPQGLQGIQGEQGETGATGSQGIQGVKGDTGDTGATGATGSQGIQGIQGVPGEVTTAAMTTAIANQTGSTITGLKETSVAMGANNIDLSLGNLFTKTISGATTLTVSNVPTSGISQSFILELTNGGSGTITWFSGAKFAKGTAPKLTASGKDIIGCYTLNGGTTWNVLVLGLDVK